MGDICSDFYHERRGQASVSRRVALNASGEPTKPRGVEPRDWYVPPPPPANDNRPRPRHLPPVVAFNAPAGGGKSTAARHLIDNHGYTLVKFAAPLKGMMRMLGLTDEHIEGSLKEVPCPLLCGKTPRYAMQTIGTEWGRDIIGADLWANAWREIASDVLDQGGRVVCDDMRFANEESVVRQLGGVVVRLEGRGGIAGGHISEAYRPRASATVWNGEGADLAGGLDVVLEAWGDMQEAA